MGEDQMVVRSVVLCGLIAAVLTLPTEKNPQRTSEKPEDEEADDLDEKHRKMATKKPIPDKLMGLSRISVDGFYDDLPHRVPKKHKKGKEDEEGNWIPTSLDELKNDLYSWKKNLGFNVAKSTLGEGAAEVLSGNATVRKEFAAAGAEEYDDISGRVKDVAKYMWKGTADTRTNNRGIAAAAENGPNAHDEIIKAFKLKSVPLEDQQ